MNLSRSFTLAFAVLGLICLVDLASGVNGPIAEISVSNYPFLVMLKTTIGSLEATVPGVFIARHYVLSMGEILADVPFEDITLTFDQYVTDDIVFPVDSLKDPDDFIIIFKTCRRHVRKVMPLTPSLYPTFMANLTGTVMWFDTNGTLYGHSTTVLADVNCDQAYLDSNASPGAYNASYNSCLEIDSSPCDYYLSDTEIHFPVLAVNGTVTSLLDWISCDGTNYNGTVAFNNIQYWRSFILGAAPSAIP
ncbi:Hypothetical predicted protein [Cloeon dipterum]|uniref:Peptidase S1 domain-containing protein n=1 Tax=Cloeon dipterum TaxID=197152 RepID=A0A8S1DM00_9INSE|nr:Hypothetical predicted protein [Cloeon dipterum]